MSLDTKDDVFLKRARRIWGRIDRRDLRLNVPVRIVIDVPTIDDVGIERVDARVPAAALTPSTRTILLHPFLAAYSRVPSSVLEYLLHHEGLHLLYPPRDGQEHPPELMQRDQAFPARARAAAWLKKHGFPVP